LLHKLKEKQQGGNIRETADFVLSDDDINYFREIVKRDKITWIRFNGKSEYSKRFVWDKDQMAT